MVNKPLIRPYLLGGVALGGGPARIPLINPLVSLFSAEFHVHKSWCKNLQLTGRDPYRWAHLGGTLIPRSHTLPKTNIAGWKIHHFDGIYQER